MTNKTVAGTICDGTYFLHPDGSAWVAAVYRGGDWVATVHEATAEMHAAAGDDLAGIVPDETDEPVVGAVCDRIVAEVFGDDTDRECVSVSFQRA